MSEEGDVAQDALVVQLRALVDQYVRDMNSAADATEKVGRAAKDTSQQVSQSSEQGRRSLAGFVRANEQVFRGMENAGRAMTIGVTAPIAALGTAVARTGTAYNALEQRSRAALTTMLGSAEAATAQMEQLYSFTSASPFPRQTFIEAQQQLIGFGMEAERIIPVLAAVQDAVAATGGSAQDISEVVDVLSRIEGQGKITGVELQRLGIRGIDAANMIADHFGYSADEVRAVISSGAIDAEMAIDALVAGIDKKMGGAAENVKRTWDGATDRVKAAFRDLSSAIVEPFVSVEGGGLAVGWANDLADGLRTLESAYRSLEPWQQTTIVGITGLVAAAPPAIWVVGRLGRAIINTADNLRAMRPFLSRTATFLTGPWGIAIGTATVAAGLFAKAKMDAARRVDELTAALEADSGAIEENTRAHAVARLETEGVLAAAEQLGIALPIVTEAALGDADAQAELARRLQDVRDRAVAVVQEGAAPLGQSLGDTAVLAAEVEGGMGRLAGELGEAQEAMARQDAAMRDQLPVLDGWQSGLSSVGGAARAAADETETAAGRLGIMSDAFGEIADEVETVTEVMQAYNDTLRALTDPVFAARQATEGLAEAQRGVEQAHRDVTAAEHDLAEARKEHGSSSEEAADAERALEDARRKVTDALLGEVRAAEDAEYSLRNLFGAIEDGTTSQAEFDARMDTLIESMGLSEEGAAAAREAFSTMAAEMLNVPDVEVEIDTRQQQKLDDLIQHLDDELAAERGPLYVDVDTSQRQKFDDLIAHMDDELAQKRVTTPEVNDTTARSVLSSLGIFADWAVRDRTLEVTADTSRARAELQRLQSFASRTGAQIAGVTGRGGMFEADGGVVDFYANGGFSQSPHRVAQIAPAGAWRVWAEPETGGEAYIPLAESKRSRSLEIWAETGRRLGVAGMASGGVSGGRTSYDLGALFGVTRQASFGDAATHLAAIERMRELYAEMTREIEDQARAERRAELVTARRTAKTREEWSRAVEQMREHDRETKKIAQRRQYEDRLAAAQAAAQLKANREQFEFDQMAASEQLRWLDRRLAAEKQFSGEWMRLARQRQQITEQELQRLNRMLDEQADMLARRRDQLGSQLSLDQGDDPWDWQASTLTEQAVAQVAQLAAWDQAMADARRRGLSDDALAALGIDGPAALGQLEVLLEATDAELRALSDAIADRNRALAEQAGRDLKGELDGIGQEAGRSWAEAIAEGLASGIPAIVDAARALQQAGTAADPTTMAVRALFDQAGVRYGRHADGSWEDPDVRIARIVADITSGRRTLAQVERSIGALPKFHTGGVVPGPHGQERLALVLGGETFRTPAQETALQAQVAAPQVVVVETVVEKIPEGATIQIVDSQLGEVVLGTIHTAQAQHDRRVAARVRQRKGAR